MDKNIEFVDHFHRILWLCQSRGYLGVESRVPILSEKEEWEYNLDIEVQKVGNKF